MSLTSFKLFRSSSSRVQIQQLSPGREVFQIHLKGVAVFSWVSWSVLEIPKVGLEMRRKKKTAKITDTRQASRMMQG